jgi:hypothetical protein
MRGETMRSTLMITATVGLGLAIGAFYWTHIDGKLLLVAYVAFLLGAWTKERSKRRVR